MGIVDIIPTWKNNDSEASSDPDLSRESRRRSDRLAWTVLVESATDFTANTLQKELSTNHGFAVGAEHPTDSFLRATGVRVSRMWPIMFSLVVTYHAQGSEPGSNPLDEPAVVLPDFSGTTEAIDEDVDGNPIVTKNGEGFDPPVTAQIYDLVLRIRKNMPSFDYQLAWEYMGDGRTEPAHNSDEFLGFPAGAARVIHLLPELVESEDFSYFRVVGTFQFRRKSKNSTVEKAWWRRVRHEGFLARFDDPVFPGVKVIDHAKVNGQKVKKPVLLKEDGSMVDYDANGDPNLAQTHWLEFQVGPEKPFNDLGFF